jgi:hypothetical protein
MSFKEDTVTMIDTKVNSIGFSQRCSFLKKKTLACLRTARPVHGYTVTEPRQSLIQYD